MAGLEATADVERFEEAIEWFQNRFPVTEQLKSELGEYAGARAWTIAGVTQLDTVMAAHSLLGKAIAEGWKTERTVDELKRVLSAYSFTGSRLNSIVRTNVQMAYSAGRYKQLSNPDLMELRPYRQLDGIDDFRQTDICRSRDGLTRPAKDPIWLTCWPPLHHGGCRTTVRALAVWELDDVDPSKLEWPADLPKVSQGFGLAPDVALPWKPDLSKYPSRLANTYRDKEAEAAKRAREAAAKRKAALEAKRRAAEETQRIEREKADKLEAERQERERQAVAEKSRKEAERIAREYHRAEKERLAKEAAEKAERERLEAERREADQKRDPLAFKMRKEAEAARDQAAKDHERLEAKQTGKSFIDFAKHNLQGEQERLDRINRASVIRSKKDVTSSIGEALDARLLTTEQLTAVSDFTGNSFGVIRRTQRDERLAKKREFKGFAAQGRAIEEAIEQNVKFEGELWRGIRITPEDAQKILESDILSWGGVTTSTSTERSVAEDFSGSDGIVFRIRNGRGMPVSDLGKKGEEEILQSGKSTFKVLGSSRDASGRRVVDLEQLHSEEDIRIYKAEKRRADEERKRLEQAKRTEEDRLRKAEEARKATEKGTGVDLDIDTISKGILSKDYETVRRSFRGSIEASGLKPAERTAAEYPRGYVIIGNDAAAMAYHDWDGSIKVTQNALDSTTRWFQKRSSRGGELTDTQRSAFGTLLHEEIHGYGQLRKDLYKLGRPAARIEEVMTETLARTSVRKATGWYDSHSYDNYIGKVSSMIADVEGKPFAAPKKDAHGEWHSFTSDWTERLARAAAKAKSSDRYVSTEDDFITSFVDAIDGLTGAQRHQLTDKLRNENWGDAPGDFWFELTPPEAVKAREEARRKAEERRLDAEKAAEKKRRADERKRKKT